MSANFKSSKMMSNFGLALLLITCVILPFSVGKNASTSEKCDSNFTKILYQNEIFQDLNLGKDQDFCRINMLKVTFPKNLVLDPTQSMKMSLDQVQEEPEVQFSKKYKSVLDFEGKCQLFIS